MERIFYQTSDGKKIFLDTYPYLMLTDTDVFNGAYKYDTIDDKELVRLYKGMESHSLKIKIFGKSENDFYTNLKNLHDTLEKDSITESYGRLYYGQYYINCVLTEKSYSSKFLKRQSTVVDYKIITSDESYWHKDILYTLEGGKKVEDPTGLNYDYNYEYNYTRGSSNEAIIENDYISSSDFVLTIHGYAYNPQVIIGDSIYRVNYTIQKEDYVIISSIDKTVTLVKSNGVVINLFPYREKSYDIFQKIVAGENNIWWNGDYDIDILLIQNRGEPGWI